MQQKYHSQRTESQSRSGKLQNPSNIQNGYCQNLSLNDQAPLGSSERKKHNLYQLYSSAATQNGELETHSGIKQHRKDLESNRNEGQIIDNSLDSVAKQTEETKNLSTFLASLLSIQQNHGSSESKKSNNSQNASKLVSNQIAQEKMSLTDFNFTQYAISKNLNLTESLFQSLSKQISQQQLLSHLHDIKTLKILPKNNRESINIDFAQFGCQTQSFLSNSQQLPIQTIQKIEETKHLQKCLAEVHETLVLESNESDFSLDDKCAQKVYAQLPLGSLNLKKNQQENEDQSFQSQNQAKNGLWEKDFFQLKHEDLKQMQEIHRRSETGSQTSQGGNLEPFLQKQKIYLKQLEQLRNEKQILSASLFKATQQLDLHKAKQRELSCKNLELETNYETLNQRLTQLLQEYRELICLVQQYKQQIFDFQNERQASQVNKSILQKEISQIQLVISKKDQEISHLQRQLTVIKEEAYDLYLINTQLEQLLKIKQEQLQEKMQQMQKQRENHTEAINFYKERLKNEGVVMDLQELSYIKDLIEAQKEEQAQKIEQLENCFRKQLLASQKEKENLLHKIAKMQQEKQKLNSLLKSGQNSYIQTEIQEVIKQYDRQLETRDEEILELKRKLKKQSQHRTQFCYSDYGKQVDQVKNLRDSVCSKSAFSTLLGVQFVYAVDKVLRINSMLLQKNAHLEHQKTQFALLMQKVQSYYQQEIESYKKQLQSSQFINSKLEQTIKDYQKKITQLKRKLPIKGQAKGTKQCDQNFITPLNRNKQKDSYSIDLGQAQQNKGGPSHKHGKKLLFDEAEKREDDSKRIAFN